MTRLTAKSLTRDIDQFLVFKHALGYPYLRGEATLRSFQRFVTWSGTGRLIWRPLSTSGWRVFRSASP